MRKGEPMSDLIDRQAAIDLVEGLESARLKGEIDLLYPKVVKGLIGLPSAQSEPTLEQIEEYCHKRCLSIIDTALLHKYEQAESSKKSSDAVKANIWM